MSFSQGFLLYFITLAISACADLLWIFVISRRLYRISLEGILRAKFNLIPAILSYVMLAFGLLIFVIVPAFNNNSIWQAMCMGTLFGLFTYGTYSLINRAMVRNWTQLIMLTDIARGMFASGVACTVSFCISQGF